MFRIRAIFSTLALSAVACSLTGQNPPPLAGPSELGLSVVLTATPDVITQDGVSQTQVVAIARDTVGQPARGVSFRADIQVDGKLVEFGRLGARSIATNAAGRAAVTYTAPQPPPVPVETDATVTIIFTPIGTNFSNSLPRTVDVRLTHPGGIAPPR